DKNTNQQQVNNQTNISNNQISIGNIENGKGIAIGNNNIVVVYEEATPQQIAAQERQSALEQLDTLPLDHVPHHTCQLPAGSRIPFGFNPHFVGRNSELMDLAKRFKGTGGRAANSQAVVMTGLGGVGKSQLAIAFAYHYGQFFQGGVHWVSMADASTVSTEIIRCGLQMAHGNLDFAKQELDIQIAKVSAQWQNDLPRLLIFDNCEDTKLFDSWRPTQGGSRILITSRQAQWGSARGVHSLPLKTLSRDQSITLLRRFRPDLIDVVDTPSLQADRNRLNTLAQLLGDHPLALHLAGSYLEIYRHDIVIDDYLNELERSDLLTHESLQEDASGYSPTDHEQHVGRTFALSTAQLDPTNPVDQQARKLLARAACFAPSEPIPRQLLFATLSASSTAMQRGKVFQRLVNLGLLEQDQTGAITIHRLICYFVQSLRLDLEAMTQVETTLAQEADIINQTASPRPLLDWQIHLRHMTDRTLLHQPRDGRTAWLAHNLGYHLDIMGRYMHAMSYLEQALGIRQTVLGAHHPDTASTHNTLGLVYKNMGKYETAREHLEQALAIRQTILDKEHPDTAKSLNNLGLVLENLGVLRDAYCYYQQALEIRIAILDQEHPDIATSLNNLGALLFKMGKYNEAHTHYEQALNIRMKVRGLEHLDTANSLSNLGALLSQIGKYDEARIHYQQALDIRISLLGQNHPSIATTLNNLGELHRTIGANEEAHTYYQQALGIYQSVFGRDHPSTANSLNNLGALLFAESKYDEAHPLLEEALAIRKKKFDGNHPDIANSLSNLGTLLFEMGKYDEAHSHIEEALQINKDLHSNAYMLNILGKLHSAMGAYQEARHYYEQALGIFASKFGSDHPNTVTVRDNLNTLLAEMDEHSINP
ncbi:MAG: tetratricopeptide repeat protein, partial [Chloroflexota bacterium]